MSTTKVINGKTFHFHPLGLFKQAHLDRQLFKIVGPALKGFGSQLSSSASIKDLVKLDFDMDSLMNGIVEGLSVLSEAEYEDFISLLLSKVQVEIPGKPPMDFATSPGLTDEIFAGNLIDLYQVMFASMKENKLSPFALMSRGLKTPKIDTSETNSNEETKTGNE